ncbi:aminotransferase class V-fold PLP-dependent enzyme [Stackebrandtia nassauensis]|uniref:Aminotransferase class V n=1 Tax=Stackebrandtia nassauensis (strain DSM 44728 / CIP 108903 / NRRL B-16338 / NBRC 102104 / LLR-40K-21) TaxID=446470 RepID=D3Q220_STANL|nr:aminotransferase class V-fold PLP-dependent enzyme [Stackebrandtia nassauensis]ADD41887.1 aminotransferase class V [Stackebrandtia nassauensis DSM 44728]
MPQSTPPEPFPAARALFTLDPDLTHLNHGSLGAVPLPVRRAHTRITDELEADPRGFFKTRVERVTATRNRLAEFVGADPRRTALVTNIVTGVSQVLQALELKAGDEIVTTDHGYGAVGYNVDAYGRHTGVVHKVAAVPLTPTADELVTAIVDQLSPRTRLVICDHITSATARLFPVAKLAAALREHDVPLLVDAAHVPGHVDADIDGIGADFWIGNLHKWSFAPRGTALLSVAEHWVGRMRPLMESWQHEAGFPVATEYNGTDDFTGWLAAPAGVALLTELGMERVRRHNSQLAHYGQTVLAQALGTTVPDDEPSPMAMRLVPLPDGVGTTDAASDAIEEAVRDELRTELTVNTFGGQGVMRVAAQIYNTPADYETLAERLPGLLKRLSA